MNLFYKIRFLLTREILDYAKIYKFTQTANKFEKICSDFKKYAAIIPTMLRFLL